MKKHTVPRAVLFLLCVGYLILVIRSAPLLPERVATHFSGSGEADGWMSRSSDLIFMGILGVGLPLFFVVISLVVGWIPDQLVNLPHRDYWLSPEHRAETHAYISNRMIWMGCLVVLLFAGIHCLMIQANRMAPPHLPMIPFLILMGMFLAGMLIWIIAFIRRFAKIP